MVKSQTLGRLRSCAKVQIQPQVSLRRYGRRQLLKQKASKGLNKRKAVQAETKKAKVDEEVDDEEADGESSSTGSNSKNKDENSSSALEVLVDNFTIEATDHRSDIDENGVDSMVGPTTAQPTSPNLDESCDDDTKTEYSGNLATPEDDLFYIEAIKSSRVGKNSKTEFLIKWEGYEKISDLTWEPEKTLIDSAPGILKEYFSAIGGRDTIGRKRKRGRPFKTKPRGRGGNITNAGKQKLEPDSVIENDKMVWSKGEETNVDGFFTEEVEGHEITLKTHVHKKTQARFTKGKTRESIRKSLHTSKKVLDLSSDSSEANFSEPNTAEPVTTSKKEATVEGINHSEGKSRHQSFKPVKDPLKGHMSASSEKSANRHSGLLNTPGNMVPSANQGPSNKVSTKYRPGLRDHTAKEPQGRASSDGKIAVEGTAKLRTRWCKSKQTKVKMDGDADEDAEIP